MKRYPLSPCLAVARDCALRDSRGRGRGCSGGLQRPVRDISRDSEGMGQLRQQILPVELHDWHCRHPSAGLRVQHHSGCALRAAAPGLSGRARASETMTTIMSMGRCLIGNDGYAESDRAIPDTSPVHPCPASTTPTSTIQPPPPPILPPSSLVTVRPGHRHHHERFDPRHPHA